MNVTLDPKLAKYVEEQVKAGKYQNAEELINGAVARLRMADELARSGFEQLRAAVAVGLDEADRGELVPFDEEAIWAEVERRYQEEQREGDAGR